MRLILLLLFLICSLFQGVSQDFYDWQTIQDIRLNFERENWSSILSRMKDAGQEQRMSADLTIQGKVYKDVGVRFKGNSSFKNVKKGGHKKLPFNIKIDYKLDDQELDNGYGTLKLSNGFRDPTFLREIISYEIFGNYLPASKCNFAKLYVNDEYIGLYSNVESVDKTFLKKHFDEKKGVFIKCDPEWEKPEPKNCLDGDKSSLMYLGDNPICYFPNYELKSDSGWHALITLTKNLKENSPELPSLLDIDQVLWMHALNNVLVNLDSYTGRLSHNYYLYQDKMGCFHPIVWDFNLSFGGFQYDGGGRGLDTEGLQTLSPFVHFKSRNPKRPLIIQLLSNSTYRKIYIAHIRTILNDYFINGEFEKRLEELANFIEPEVLADPNKLYSNEAFRQNISQTVDAGGTDIIGLKELMVKRTEYLTNHPLLTAAPPEVGLVEHFKFDKDLAIQATLDNVEEAWVFYRESDRGPFKMVALKDDGGSNDQSFQDGVWGTTLNYKEGLQYYVVAENQMSASLYPERASKDFIEVEKMGD